MQATAVTQATTVAPATSNIKNDSSIMTACSPKAGMFAKTVKLTTAWMEANSRRDDRNIQCCGSGSRIWCFFEPWIRDPEKKLFGSRIPNSYF
jgi:hypothetical protein